jgi:hypothetical protein
MQNKTKIKKENWDENKYVVGNATTSTLERHMYQIMQSMDSGRNDRVRNHMSSKSFETMNQNIKFTEETSNEWGENPMHCTACKTRESTCTPRHIAPG